MRSNKLFFGKKFILLPFSIILTIELILQVIAYFNPVYRSFDALLKARTKENATMTAEDTQNTIFFVGDSTIYGIGATEQKTASLPAQFEKLLQKVFPDHKCVNLGFPGSPTDMHLKILDTLPKGAIVIYRGGYIDRVYHADNSFKFRFIIGNKVCEIRTLKMLAMLFSGFIPIKNIDETRQLIAHIPKIVQKNNLQLYSLGYSIYAEEHNALTRYCSSHNVAGVTIIPLRELMIGSRYLNQQQILSPEFRNLSGSHPNDVGYQVEADYLFNWFCTKKLLDLDENHINQEKPLEAFKPEFLRRYQSKLQVLQKATKNDLQQAYQLHNISRAISDLWMELRQIHLYPEMSEYISDYQKIEKLNTHIFHSENVLFGYLMSACFAYIGAVTETSVIPDEQKMRLYTAIMRATISPEHEQRKNIETLLKKSNLPFSELKMTYIPELRLYPLELCPRFQQESNLSPEELASAEAWELFFNIPYSYFTPDSIEKCRL